MKRIDPEWIQSISVFKNAKATEMYGCNGKNGVIIIALKEG
jgi:TonB-dependent SusC/RagA subfamily outer membrane receptor